MLMLSYASTQWHDDDGRYSTEPDGVGMIAEEASVPISFLTWMAFGIPIGMLMLVTAWLLLRLQNSSQIDAPFPSTTDMPNRLSEWTRGQINACVAFAVAILLWIVPRLLEPSLDHNTTWSSG